MPNLGEGIVGTRYTGVEERQSKLGVKRAGFGMRGKVEGRNERIVVFGDSLSSLDLR